MIDPCAGLNAIPEKLVDELESIVLEQPDLFFRFSHLFRECLTTKSNTCEVVGAAGGVEEQEAFCAHGAAFLLVRVAKVLGEEEATFAGTDILEAAGC